MTKMFKQTALVSVLAGCTAFSVAAQTDQSTTSSQGSYSPGTAQATSPTHQSDNKAKEFIKEAMRDNNMETAMIEVAVRKAQNPELKSFAQKLQQDHQQAGQQLQQLAQTHGVNLEDATEAKNAREVTKLENEENGAKFDREFATGALKHHSKDIQNYQKAVNEVQAQDVKQFAQMQLPKLRQHFEQAQTVARAVGVEQSTISSYAKKVPAAVGGTSDQPDTTHGSGTSTGTNAPLYPK